MSDDLGGYKRPEPALYEPPTAAPINTPEFNPFAALGLDPATATAADIRPAYIRSMRHRHENAIARFPATATNFPSQVQVQQAYEYLSSSATRIATATIRWGHRHHDVFFPQHEVGSNEVFRAAPTATPNRPAATPNRPTPATPATATASGSSYRPSPDTASSSQPRKARRTAASGSGSSPGSAANPFDLSSEEDDDDDDGPATPTPAARSRPSRGLTTTTAAAAAAAAGNVGNPRPAPRNPRPRTQRSGGSSQRNASVANPVTNERITVGTWANAAAAATPNAVIAGFDARGRMFYRIVNADLQGNPVAAPTATATRFEDVVFRVPYQGMTAAQVRTAVDQHLRLNPFQRP